MKVIATFSAEAATALKAALDLAKGKAVRAVAAPDRSQPVSVEVSPSNALQLAIFGLADELDLPARRVRRPLARFFASLRSVSLGLDTAEQQLTRWIAEQRY